MKYLLLAGLVSCSVAQVNLNSNEILPYKESSQVTRVQEKLKPIRINSVKDNREEKIFGHAFTGVQYTKTPILFEKSADDIVKDLIADSLEARNIIVHDEAQTATLDIEINQMWVEEVIEEFQPEKAKCNLDLSFHITTDNKKWSGEFQTEFISGGDLSDGTERLAPTLASCFNELVEKLVSDEKFLSVLK